MRLARAHHPQLTGLQGILYKNFEAEENGLLVKVVVDVDLPLKMRETRLKLHKGTQGEGGVWNADISIFLFFFRKMFRTICKILLNCENSTLLNDGFCIIVPILDHKF